MSGVESQKIRRFIERTERAAGIIREHIKSGSFIRVTSHLDSDGLAAAGIIGCALARADACFRIRIVKQMDTSVIEEASSDDASLLIFTDLGSGQLDLIEGKVSSNDVLVLDHHPPVKSLFPGLIHVNPRLEELDGDRGISGAGVAYFVAKSLDQTNSDLSPVAVVGAIGDLQDSDENHGMLGLNKKILNDAVSAGYVKTGTDLLFYGRATRPIHKALAYTTNPFIPGLSGEEDKCLGFITNLGIELKNQDRWRVLSDLTEKEKKTLFSELAKVLSSQNFPSTVTFSLIGTVYTLIREEQWTPLRDAREYASLLNACGRMDNASLGIAICMGSRGAILEEAQEVLLNYRRKLSKYMEWLTHTPDVVEELKNIYVIKGGDVIDDTMIGVVASILTASNLVKLEKPVIAFSSSSNGMVKVSGRTTSIMTGKGLNRGAILGEASEKFRGRGGGHDIAAGAQIPQGSEDKFVILVDNLVFACLNPKSI